MNSFICVRIYSTKDVYFRFNVCEGLGELGATDIFQQPFSSVTLLVTMRGASRPAGVQRGDVPVLTPLSLEAARRTFIAISPPADDCLDKLLNSLDCVALAVTLVARVGQESNL